MQKVPDCDPENDRCDQYKVDLLEDLRADRKNQPPQLAFRTPSKPPRLNPTNSHCYWHIKKPLHEG
jgi:hypothetical protein